MCSHIAYQSVNVYTCSTCTLHDCVSGCLQIEMNVGQCRPLATIYSDAYEVACLEAVDGLVRDTHRVVPACEVVVYMP